MTTAKNSEVFPLTSLRFFLASWIVWFHLEVSGTSKLIHPGTVPFNILRCAYVAVGIFFLLSGFILALNYPLDRTWNAAMKWKFWDRSFFTYLSRLPARAGWNRACRRGRGITGPLPIAATHLLGRYESWAFAGLDTITLRSPGMGRAGLFRTKLSSMSVSP